MCNNVGGVSRGVVMEVAKFRSVSKLSYISISSFSFDETEHARLV